VKGSTNPQNTWGFATYWQDSVSGLDYAHNRYYTSAYGRFMTPDPYQASGGPQDPGSWNRYAYTRGDPANRRDPLGLADCTTCDDGGDDGYCPPSIQSCAPLGGGGGGDPNEAWYQQVARETTGLDSLVGQGLISNWDFVNGSIYQIQFTLNGLMLFVPYYAVAPVAKPSGGYWAYVNCFLTGIAGAEINNPEVPGVSMWAILQGLVTGAAWGPGVAVVGGVTITVDFFNIENKVAHDCAKQTGYTPWILQN
jgi:RHS repeat-associated protein